MSFSTRADLPNTHPLAAYLLHLISIKKSNLCVSADVHSTSALLRLAEQIGDSICVLKTHADIIDDFGERTMKGLKEISRRKKFLLFEDRKFGDIGNTVQSQYTRGPLYIATWAHLTNAHIFPGPSIITSLHTAALSTVHTLTQSVSTEISAGTPHPSSDFDSDSDSAPKDYGFIRSTSLEKRPFTDSGRKGSVVTATTTISQTIEKNENKRVPGSLARGASIGEGEEGDRAEALQELGEPPLARGLLLLAEMSSEGNLMDAAYTSKCISSARSHPDFILGFICQHGLNDPRRGDNFLAFTPGVSLPPEGEDRQAQQPSGDGLGQRYRTPQKVIAEGCDVIVVGRGILGAKDRVREAERYRREAWRAYEARLGKGNV